MKKNLSSTLNQEPSNKFDKFRSQLINYIDGALRGIISFIFVGIGLYIILVGWMKVKPIYVLPIVFVTSVLISPLLSKIRYGEKLMDKYDKMLEGK